MIKVFVSRDRPWKFFNEVARKWPVAFVYRSCIKLELIEKEEPAACDWVFFSSPMGLSLFMKHFGLRENQKVAVIGRGTAAAMAAWNREVDFLPESDSIEQAIIDFAERLEANETVLYPRSARSFKRMKEVLPSEQLIDFPFYRPEPDAPKHPVYDDYIVLTSPSNAEAYLGVQRLRSGQRLVAIGESTARRLAQLGADDYLTSDAPAPEAIWQCISKDAGLATT